MALSPSKPSSRALVIARAAFAVLLAIAAANHARLAAAGAGAVARHELFVGLNLGLAVLVLARPRWALAPAVALSLQQAFSHGSDLVASIRAPGPLDYASLGVVVFFPALITLLVVERRTRDTPAPPRGGSPGSSDTRPGS